MTKNHIWGWAILVFLSFITHASAITYTLTLVTNGPGTIAENPPSASYPAGATVTLTATPNNNALFTGWSGGVTGTINPTNVTINSSLVITGNFSASSLETITLTTNGQGSITLNPSGGTYASNSIVTLTATPAAGWLFTSWSGDTNTTTNPLTVALTNNLNITGNFAELPAFDIQPINVSNKVGGNVSFTTHAVGSGTLGYQWYFSGNPLSGATSASLNLTGIQLANAGNYYVIVTNAYGSTTSATAALVITNLPGSTNAVNIGTEANLRAAIAAGGWVSINCNGPYNLTSTINITNHVILDASGFNAVINGGGNRQLFYIVPGASLTATNLVLANGCSTNGYNGNFLTYGGAVYNNGGSLTLVFCTLTNNLSSVSIGGNYPYNAAAGGGAIANFGGNVSLFYCAISNNTAVAGTPNSAFSFNSYGGAIFNTNGNLTLIGCNISSNQSTAWAGSGAYGGGVCQASGTFTASGNIFSENVAYGAFGGNYIDAADAAFGGALAIISGPAKISGCQFLGNLAQGGEINYYVAPGSGGALYSASSALAIDYCSFSGNAVLAGNQYVKYAAPSMGGAIYNAGIAILNHSCIFSNTVQGSIGFLEIVGNYYMPPGGNGMGGGIFNSASLAITNSTIALNFARGGPGGSDGATYTSNGNAIGGGIYNSLNATSALMNVTIASNLCIAGGYGLPPTNGFSAGDQIANTNGGYLSIRNSLLAYAGTNGNAYGTIVDGGYNFSSDGSANFSGGTSFNYTDPQLLALANNGGPTLTMALAAASPAIDYGSSVGAPNTDQRGYARPVGDGVDSGAYEYGSHPLPWLDLAAAPGAMQLNFSANPGFTYYLQCSSNLITWTDIETNGPFATYTNLTSSYSTQIGSHWFYRLLMQ